MAHKVIISITHDCPLNTLQRKLSKSFRVYCNGFFDYFIFNDQINEDEVNIIQSILEYNQNNYTVEQLFYDNVVILACIGDQPYHLMHFYRLISEAFGIIFAYPKITKNGEEYLFHCLDSEVQSAVFDKLTEQEFKIESIHEYQIEEYYWNYMFSIPELIGTLTKKQMDIITEAYRSGYYEIPRKIKTKQIASSNKTSRYNIDKILRKAEKNIMDFVYPFLK